VGAGVCVVVAAWLAALCVYDIRERRLPNFLTLPGALAVLGWAAFVGRGWPAVAGAVMLCGLYLLVHLIAPTAMGAGDVKLAAGLGGLTGFVGIDVWALAALGAPVLTALWAAVELARGRRTVAHGPSMCLATAAAVMVAVL
jgi:leader peptidase (prepilin peptidase) / N-methyltransferase